MLHLASFMLSSSAAMHLHFGLFIVLHYNIYIGNSHEITFSGQVMHLTIVLFAPWLWNPT